MELSINQIGPSFQGRKYQVEEWIGQGSFGHVYRVKQRKGKCASPALHNQSLALKIYHYCHRSYQRPVIDEIIQSMALARSSCTAQYFDRSPAGEKPEYIVMEYVPETIDTRLERAAAGEYPTQGTIRQYLQQMPTVLESLRDAGVVHGDIKRSNIGFKCDQLKLLDFGLARMTRRASPKVPPLPKKRVFYPPEVQEDIITPALDIYCAGKVLESVLIGRYAAEVEETIEAIEFLHDIRLPVSWQKMLRAMLHPDHERRARPGQLHQLMGRAAAEMDSFQFKDFVPLGKIKFLPSSSSFLPQ